MAPVYKLKYFNYMGLAEPIRYLLAYGNIQYENIVVSDTDWINMQKVVPFSILPILEVENKVIFHSLAISKYLGKQVGLIPFDEFEMTELDAVVDATYELGWQVWKWNLQENREMKSTVEEALIDVIIPKWFYDLEDILKKKGTYFGGKKLSWADIYVVGILEFVELLMNRNWLSNYPLLKQLTVEVKNIPAIKTYIKKRPNYKY